MNPHQYADAALAYSPNGTNAAEIVAAFIAKLKRRMMRARTEAKRPGTLAEKLAAQAKAQAAEIELNRVRRQIFDIEDEVKNQLPES